MRGLSRREFLKLAGAVGAGVVLLGPAGCAGERAELLPRPAPPAPAGDQPYLVVARDGDPAAITRAAVEALGGMGRFVASGDDVVVKPNICVDYHPPEYAATSNPDVVAEVVRMCLEAGAGRVRVMDMPFGGTPESAYLVSGVGASVEAAGGQMVQMTPVGFVEVAIPDGQDLTAWQVYRDVLTADVLIDVPIAKHHSLGRLSLGGKNMMGVISRPERFHTNLGQRVADLLSLVRPTLTVVDAYRILVAHGPTGGSLNDVRQVQTVIASHDIVAADAYAATLFGLTGADIPYVRAAAEMGLGTLDLDGVRVAEVNVG